ncbi:MAG: DUF3021 domain-containing protein [Oscillospiraceae bacterium]|nr:DUF3021 domain-containing protein [Oscillospiraceae bacterium]
MKKYIAEFMKRGLMAAAGGPVVLAIIYGCLGGAGVIDALSPAEVCMGILSVTLMAFIAAGITMVYSIEQLPLISVIMLHGGILYLDYLIMYLLNSWIPRDLHGIGIFTAIFVTGYAIIWAGIYCSIRAKTERINKKLV